jgi:hypothetical protein
MSFAVTALTLAACGGGGSSSPVPQSSGIATTSQPTATSVTVSGKITYDRVGHTNNFGLDYANVNASPARGIVVEAVNASDTVIASTITGLNGDYSFTLEPDTNIRIQAKAQILSEGEATWNFQVTDNTQGNSLYALQGSLASTGSSAAQSRDLHAPLGWTGSSYTEARASAPFAIIDSVFTAVQTFAKIDPNIDFPALELRWSVKNRTVVGDKSQGFIGTSSYDPDEEDSAIYLLGEEDRDTDEFDPHVIIHEWGHYFEHQMSRADSFGGLHSLTDRLDPRVAFSEGWSNALSAAILKDPQYRDSSGASQKFGFSFSLESQTIRNPGWYSEASIGAVIYDILDSGVEENDTISDGLASLYAIMTDPDYKNKDVFATIFSLTDAMRQSGRFDTAALNTLLASQNISGQGADGSGESNSGAIRSALPVYKEASLNGPSVKLCSVDDAGTYNKLGNREFIFLNLQNDTELALAATKSSGDENRDPDFNIWQGNRLIDKSRSSKKGAETFQGQLSAGNYVIEVYDFFNINGTGSKRGDGCYNFTVTG